MTNEEAIIHLQAVFTCANNGIPFEVNVEALELATKALKERDYLQMCVARLQVLEQQLASLNNDREKIRNRNNWILVKEDLPEFGHAVLVYCPDNKNIFCACLVGKCEWHIFGTSRRLEEEVVAWTNLPDYPDIKTEEE